VSGAIIVRRLQRDDGITVVGQGQSSFCNGWSRNDLFVILRKVWR